MFTIALAVAAGAPAAAQAWMPEPVQFTRTAATDGGGKRADVRTGRRFDLVGLEWRGARSAHAELRVRLASGRWSRWAHADPADGPDRGEGRGRTVSPPVWAGGARRVQVRLSRPVRGLRLRLVNTTGSSTRAARARTRARVAKRGAFGAQSAPATGAPQPGIIPRSAWGASRCRPRDVPSYGNVRVAYVHHTVSLNGYSRARAASMVLGICLFHRNGNGWDDIGYDFLVDRYGRVFEGRSGGADAPVIGAHSGGFNSESTGVAMLGSFSSSAPPRRAIRSLERLLAWKLSVHGVPAIGRARVTSLGGPSTSYRAGTRVKVNRISGHRDVNLTACPGAALYRRLPAIRRAVARRQGELSALTIAPVATQAPYGAGVAVSGLLTLPGDTDPAGAAIEVRQLTGGEERILATTVAGADGGWSAQLPAVTSRGSLRAVFAGDAGRPGVASNTAYVDVVPQIDLAVSPTSLAAEGTVVATGSVRPGKRRVRVTAYLQRADGTERRAVRRRVPARDGTYSASLPLRRAGSYRLVTTASEDLASLAGSSPSVFVQVAPGGSPKAR
jgi:hypothetical protein